MKKYILSQKVEQFKPEAMDLLVMTNQKQTYFSDIMWAMQSGKDSKGQTQIEAIQFVLNSKAVKEAVHSLVEENMLKL